jgi:hypothetical protein
MTRTIEFLLATGFVLGTTIAVPLAAHAQPGYTGRITFSSNDGRRNWCAIGGVRDVQLIRQISGSACIRDNT